MQGFSVYFQKVSHRTDAGIAENQDDSRYCTQNGLSRQSLLVIIPYCDSSTEIGNIMHQQNVPMLLTALIKEFAPSNHI